MKPCKHLIVPLLAAAAFIGAITAINYFGLFRLLAKLNEPHVGLPLIFLIGVLASFHCVGMCGGFVVAVGLKKNTGRNDDDVKPGIRPQLGYNLGRLISYSAIGGILGGFGAFFGINPTLQGIVLLGAAFFMLIFGLSLLTEFEWLKRFRLRIPLFAARYLYANRDNKRLKSPLLIGLANGLMPCGPLQAMELYALTSGNALDGALGMGVFALGTAPLLLGLGHAVNKISREKVGAMMKYSGAIVMVLGLVMFWRGLGNLGLNAAVPAKNTETAADETKTGFQEVRMSVTYYGYQPNVLYVKRGIPVRWIIDGSGITGCTNEIILSDYGISRKLSRGENIIEFTPRAAGEIKFSCGMRMVWGKFVVTEGGNNPLDRGDAGSNIAPANVAQAAVCADGATGCGANTGCGGQGCSCGCGNKDAAADAFPAP